MYLRRAEKKGFKTELIEETLAKKQALNLRHKISGHNSYGFKTESGVIVWCVSHLLIVSHVVIPVLRVFVLSAC